MPKYPSHLTLLMTFLRKLPGIGLKTAERFAFQMLDWQENDLKKLSSLLSELKEKITYCPSCHCMMEDHKCAFCDNPHRNSAQICILASAKDAFMIEETKVYTGLYHVIGSLLSPMDGQDITQLRLAPLKERVEKLKTQEIILAIDSTLEGDTTSLYLKEELQSWGLKVFRLAFGIPLGSSLDFVDGGTLARALTSKQLF